MKEWLIKLGKVITIGFGNAIGGETKNCYYEVGLTFMIIFTICILLLLTFSIIYFAKKEKKNNGEISKIRTN